MPLRAADTFICHRRGDTQEVAQRLRDYLHDRLGELVFIDARDIAHGESIKDVIDKQLEKTAVMLVLVGPGWAGTTAADGTIQGECVLDTDEGKWIRYEIETAYKLGIDVRPVLVNNAPVPKARDASPLPLRQLLDQLFGPKALPLHQGDEFYPDAERIVDVLSSTFYERNLGKLTASVKGSMSRTYYEIRRGQLVTLHNDLIRGGGNFTSFATGGPEVLKRGQTGTVIGCHRKKADDPRDDPYNEQLILVRWSPQRWTRVESVGPGGLVAAKRGVVDLGPFDTWTNLSRVKVHQPTTSER